MSYLSIYYQKPFTSTSKLRASDKLIFIQQILYTDMADFYKEKIIEAFYADNVTRIKTLLKNYFIGRI